MPSQHAPEHRAQQNDQPQIHGAQQCEGYVVDRDGPLPPRQLQLPVEDRQHRPREEGAVGAAAELGVVEQEEHHLPERQRHHQEEETACAQRQGADQERGGASDRNRRRERDENGAAPAIPGDEVDRVGGEAVERGVPQADKPGAADQQLQTESQHRRNEGVGAEFDVVARDEERQRGEHERAEPQHHRHRFALRQHQRPLSSRLMCAAARTGPTGAITGRRPSAHKPQGPRPWARMPCPAYRPVR